VDACGGVGGSQLVHGQAREEPHVGWGVGADERLHARVGKHADQHQGEAWHGAEDLDQLPLVLAGLQTAYAQREIPQAMALLEKAAIGCLVGAIETVMHFGDRGRPREFAADGFALGFARGQDQVDAAQDFALPHRIPDAQATGHRIGQRIGIQLERGAQLRQAFQGNALALARQVPEQDVGLHRRHQIPVHILV
jgi:hypothetical protein